MTKFDQSFSYKDGVSLKEHFDSRLESTEKALDLAKSDLDHRLENMNEFRDQLREQAARFITRDELDTRMDAMISKNESVIHVLEMRLDAAIASLEEKIEVASKGKVTWGVALAVTILTSLSLSLIILLVTHVL